MEPVQRFTDEYVRDMKDATVILDYLAALDAAGFINPATPHPAERQSWKGERCPGAGEPVRAVTRAASPVFPGRGPCSVCGREVRIDRAGRASVHQTEPART